MTDAIINITIGLGVALAAAALCFAFITVAAMLGEDSLQLIWDICIIIVLGGTALLALGLALYEIGGAVRNLLS